MKIFYNKKKLDLSNVCKNVNDFIDLIDQKKGIKKWINFENPKMYEKMEEFFNFCLKSDGCINFESFNKLIIKFFNFKNGFITSCSALIEHGFTEDEANNILWSFKDEYRKREKLKKEKLFETKKEYFFGYINYSSSTEPICNICGSKLEFTLMSNGTKKILGCSNNDCIASTKNNACNEKYRAVLPNNLYKKHINTIKTFSRLNINYWLKKGYTQEEAKNNITEIQKNNSKKVKKRGIIDKDFFIKKYGEISGNKKLRERSCFCKEFWIKKGYTEEEAIKKIKEIQINNSYKIKEHITCRMPEFWFKKGYNKDETNEMISKVQSTFSKKKCIEKYGEEEGIKRWKERQNRWQETLHKTGNLHVGYSNISQELFNEILTHYIGDNIDYVFYGSKNHEYSLRDDGVNYIYDFTDLEKRKIIEFQGDIYHGNPELFTENEHPNPFKKDKTCKELWEFDNKKADVAIKNNFEILRIWEKDYRENKKETINKCLKFLKHEK